MCQTAEQAAQRQAEQCNQSCELQQALKAQPQIATDDKRMSIIGHGFFGDVAVDLWGVIDRHELDVWDVALAGTTVSLKSVISGKQWDALQDRAQDIYDRQREAA